MTSSEVIHSVTLQQELFASNPFATKFIRAGAMPYHFLGEESFERLKSRLISSNWRGQIVGPHGSGKSTLLGSLSTRWRDWGKSPYQVCLRDRQSSLPTGFWKRARESSSDILVIDGYEQLNAVSRTGLLLRCRLQRCGLLVTSHYPVRWLTQLFRTHTNEALAEELAVELLANPQAVSLAEGTKKQFLEKVSRSYAVHDGNLREVFLALYDEVAARSS